MKRKLLLGLLLFSLAKTKAQVEVSKLIGKNSSDYTIGYGGFLKFSHPVSDAADVSLEVGAIVFQSKIYDGYGWAVVPVKAGYRYTLNGSGYGFYLEPQAGYNIYGINVDDNKF